MAALAVISIILDAIIQNKDETELGYFFDYMENLVLVDLAKAVRNLPQGTTIRFEGFYFRLRGDKFISIDPDCSGCVLKQDPDGKITIEGCKRCTE